MVRSPLNRIVFALTAILAIAGLAASASAQDKLDRALRDASRSGKAQRVIFKSKAGYEAWARKLLTDKGKTVDADLPSVGSFAVELTAGEMEVLCNSTVSDGCSADAMVSPSAKPNRPGPPLAAFFAPQVNTLLRTLGLSPNSFGGLGVAVALIDSGIYPSAAFDKRIKAFYDFTGGGIRSTHPFDDYGHGTHVAGLIGGQQDLTDLAFEGVAPSVQFVGLKVLDKTGAGRTSDVIRAIEFAIANRAKYGIDIINLSLGHPIFEPADTDPLVRAVEKATAAGIIVVASAGNYGVDEDGEIGYGGITSPGNAPSALTVGAADHNGSITRDDDKIAAYSSNGPTWYDGLVKPDFIAPGHFLMSEAAPRSSLYKAYPSLRKKGQSGKEFMRLSGTSMAAAVVTGVVALMEQSTHGALTANLAKGVLQFTAIPLSEKETGTLYSPLRQGTGEINAKGALNLLNHIDATITALDQPWITGEVVKATTI